MSTAPWTWTLAQAQCIGCAVCADVCDADAIIMTREMSWPEAKPGACVGCMLCVHECPTEALSVQRTKGTGTPRESPNSLA